MKVVYIAGPYRAYRKDGNYDIDAMFERAMDSRRIARKYVELGFAVIAPLMNMLMLDSDKLADDFWIKMDKELVARCDVIVMMKGWEHSTGATTELAHANSLGLHIIYE
jgi:hypothetical protein